MPEPAAALVFAEPSGVVRIWNSAAEALFGHRSTEAIGQTLDLIVPPEFRARHWAGFRAAMAAAEWPPAGAPAPAFAHSMPSSL